MQLESSYRSIWRLTFPIIVGSLAQSITQLIDAVFLGRVSFEQLGASNLSGMFYMFLLLIGMGFTRGGQIIFARRSGEKKDEEIGGVFDNMFVLCSVICVLMFGLIYFYNHRFAYTIIQSDAIRSHAIDYLQIRGWSLPFSLFNIAMMAFFTGIGNTRIISFATVVLAFVNIFFDYVMIFGKLGFPAWELKGAAWASNIAEMASSLTYFFYLAQQKYIQRFGLFRFSQVNTRLIKKIAFLSAPLVVQNIIGLGTWQAFFLMIEKMGEEALGISTIIKSLYMFIGIPVWSFASASNSLVSNLLGQKKIEEVLVAIRRVIIMSVLFSAVVCLIIFLIPEPILSAYTTDKEIIQKSLPSLYVILVALMLFSVGIALFQGLMGSGDTVMSLIIEASVIVVYMVWTYFMIFYFRAPLHWVWSCEVVYWVFITVASLIYLKSGRWKKIKV